MRLSKALLILLVIMLAAFSLAACSGQPRGGVCTVNCTVTGNGTVSFTLAAVPFTPPPGTSILSFELTLGGIQLTPTSGTAVSIPLNNPAYVVDLTRLQSDSAFLGQLVANVPAGTYNQVTVAVTNAVVTYCTDLGGISGCDTGSVVQVPSVPLFATPATSTFSATLAANQQMAIQIQLNLSKAITISTTLPQVVSGVNLTAANVLTASVLAPTSSTSSLATGQLDFVEDVTGMVTATSSSSVTVQTSTHGSITASMNQSPFLVANCVTTTAACAPKIGQFASIDTALNSDGTFTVLEYDPIAPTSSDWIEGIVSTIPSSSTQFQIVTNDISLASTGTLIGTNLSVAAPVQVTLSSVNLIPFVVDNKGLTVVATNFAGSSDATTIIPGQTVALHVTAFTAKNGNVLAAATVDTVVLRFTRVAGSISQAGAAIFDIQSLPPFFGSTASYEVQISSGSPSTNFDGVPNGTSLIAGKTAAMRALFLGPPGTANPSFSAAKVRQFQF